jgi:hypothetical protein
LCCSNYPDIDKGYFKLGANQQTVQEGKTSDLMYALSQGPDHRARIFNRCFINVFLFQTANIENNLSTQNSGIIMRGDDNTENMDWYGKIKKIIALDFPNQKEVVIVQCDWYDVPAADKKKSSGYNMDQYGIIDIYTTKF